MGISILQILTDDSGRYSQAIFVCELGQGGLDLAEFSAAYLEREEKDVRVQDNEGIRR